MWMAADRERERGGGDGRGRKVAGSCHDRTVLDRVGIPLETTA